MSGSYQDDAARRDFRYLIIGNSAAGIGAAEAIREADADGSIAVLSDETYHCYARPLISLYLTGDYSLERMLYRPAGFYRELRIEPVLGRRAAGVDLESQKVVLEDGSAMGYEKLLLATGGRPFIPPIPGINRPGVYTFTTLAEVERLLEPASAARRVVVIGGGLIGLQAAEAFRKLGKEVTVVELMNRVLGPALDERGSEMVAALFRSHGVAIRTGVRATTVVGTDARTGTVSAPAGGTNGGTKGTPGNGSAGNGSAEGGSAAGAAEPDAPAGGVTLADGEVLPADLVVVAVGVGPRTELAAGAGDTIAVNRGILVDENMGTTAPGVYAAGDVAEVYDFLAGVKRVVPIWPNAYAQGRIAGFNMAGRVRAYPGQIPMNACDFFGFGLVSAGILNPEGDGRWRVLEDYRPEHDYYKKLILKDDRIVGLVCAGDAVDRAGIVLGFIRKGTPSAGFVDDLFNEFGVKRLPDKLRRERIMGGVFQ